MSEIFISYSRSTERQALTIAEALRTLGYSVWRDDQLLPHLSYSEAIQERLEQAKAVLVLWSKEAVGSQWVRSEANQARERNKVVQVSLDGSMPPMPFDQIQCAQLDGWSGDPHTPDWGRVIQSVSELVGHPPTNGAAVSAVMSPATAVLPPTARERLLAILAFDNLSGDPDLSYFSDGVSEEIQHMVAQNTDLRVIARSSSFQFRGADKAVRKVAAELKVTHLLDGSVRRSGERVRISAQLVRCDGEETLWANRFDGDLSDVFALQDRIAQAVADALKVTLAPPAQAPAIEPQGYEDFLRARAIITEGGQLYDAAAAEATPLLEAVVRDAPGFAPAWELLASARAWTLRGDHREAPYEIARAGVVEAAETALRLDPKRGGAYAALAMLEPWGAYAERETLLHRALAVSPNDPGLLTELSTLLWSVGRFRDALRQAERACELNPLMPAARLQVAQMRAYVGDYAGSIRMHVEIHRRWPHNFTILADLLNTASTLGFWDAYREAEGEVAQYEGWQGAYLRETLRYVDALESKDPEKAQALLERWSRLVAKTGTLPLNYLVGLSMLGLPDTAMDLAETASFAHVFDPDGPPPSGVFPGTILGPWTTFNRNPRFIDLCDRLGLCAYWVRSDKWPDCIEWVPYDFKAEARRRLAG